MNEFSKEFNSKLFADEQISKIGYIKQNQLQEYFNKEFPDAVVSYKLLVQINKLINYSSVFCYQTNQTVQISFWNIRKIFEDSLICSWCNSFAFDPKRHTGLSTNISKQRVVLGRCDVFQSFCERVICSDCVRKQTLQFLQKKQICVCQFCKVPINLNSLQSDSLLYDKYLYTQVKCLDCHSLIYLKNLSQHDCNSNAL